MNFKKDVVGNLKKFWDFLKEDSWQSLLVSLILAFAIIKFIVFPILIFLTGTPLPLVIVESCSMHHSESLEDIVDNQVYAKYGLDAEDSKGWGFKNGFTKGDVIFVVKDESLEVGDVIVFNSGGKTRLPVIHRIISLEEGITTKGDNNPGLLSFEENIPSEAVLGRAVFRVPFVGWIKLIFFDWQKDTAERGFCN